MTVAIAKPITLEEFLELPETKPASEFLDGQINQKPMPQGEHSLLQLKLCQNINRVTEPKQVAIAFPELRCVFGGAAIVPDVSVFRWERIPRQPSGRIANRFEIHPNWAIEILSPEQKYKKVLANLLHCAEHGTELGWLLDPEDESILAVFDDRRVQNFKNSDRLPILNGIELELTVRQVFSWLNL
ncbi:MAG: Uma2 family endonuclease [Cyanosarcina radialis HA8281-LM2]|jgi:Uma2 family endonuclease|nr:Uma2 family endonuclease [Cyanosarcina radialis HA8281-LM2]